MRIQVPFIGSNIGYGRFALNCLHGFSPNSFQNKSITSVWVQVYVHTSWRHLEVRQLSGVSSLCHFEARSPDYAALVSGLCLLSHSRSTGIIHTCFPFVSWRSQVICWEGLVTSWVCAVIFLWTFLVSRHDPQSSDLTGGNGGWESTDTCTEKLGLGGCELWWRCTSSPDTLAIYSWMKRRVYYR